MPEDILRLKEHLAKLSLPGALSGFVVDGLVHVHALRTNPFISAEWGNVFEHVRMLSLRVVNTLSMDTLKQDHGIVVEVQKVKTSFCDGHYYVLEAGPYRLATAVAKEAHVR